MNLYNISGCFQIIAPNYKDVELSKSDINLISSNMIIFIMVKYLS